MRRLLLALLLGGVPVAAQDPPPAAGVLVTATALPPGAVWVDSLDLAQMSCGWRGPLRGKSVEGNPLKLAGVTYAHGVGTHAVSEFVIDLKSVATRFVAMVGLDDEKRGLGSVTFTVLVDGREAARTPTLRGGDPPQLLDVDLTGAKRLTLQVGDAGDGIASDHADWCGAMILCQPGATARPTAFVMPPEPPLPLAHGSAPEPRINGPRVVGSTPGKPFLFLIPATGEGPLRYAAEGLPAGLTLDASTGILTGSLTAAGTTPVKVTVTGPRGTATRDLTIIGGAGQLAQTPPLGWNSWNCYAGAVNDQRIRATIDAFVSQGLAAHGYAYVNIDDCWAAERGADGRLRPNERFPDLKALADYAHSKGLKLGIYSSPGPQTCAGFPGSWQHELQDAATWAEWGIDYLKHDWCSYGDVATGEDPERLQQPYRVMRTALDQCSRDIVFSLCQYGMGNVWEWGAAVGGNLWRTTGDITDTWHSMAGIGFSQSGQAPYAGPGHWNDPDMLVVGQVGWGTPRANRLTPNEQITHFTLWCLQAAPLLLGCDVTQLDDFTRDLITNDEVLEVDQDPLGQAAGRVAQQGRTEVWARPLSDGTWAVGLFNRGIEATDVTVGFDLLQLTGERPVRDLWQRRDLTPATDAYTVNVPGHAAVLVKIGRPARDG